MKKITLPISLNGNRYGIDFVRGVGHTDNEKLIKTMEDKGFLVEDAETVVNFDKDDNPEPTPPKRRISKKPAQSSDDE